MGGHEGDDSVSRIDVRVDTVGKPSPLATPRPQSPVGGVAVWVANAGDGSVTRIDQRTNRVTATIAVGPRPQGIVVAGGSVWVTVRS